MRYTTARLRVLAAIPLALIASCDGNGVTTPPPPPTPAPLPPGIWFMHEANDEALPAMIADRIVGVAQEQTFLDSARLVVGANGAWEQRYWFRVNVTQNLDRAETILDEGTWGPPYSATYLFESNVRARTFSATIPRSGVVLTNEVMLHYVGASAVTGRYLQTHP